MYNLSKHLIFVGFKKLMNYQLKYTLIIKLKNLFILTIKMKVDINNLVRYLKLYLLSL